jgi:endonuclease G
MTPQVAVRVHVQRKKPVAELSADELFPRELDGVPIDVIEAVYRPQHLAGTATAVNSRAARFDEIPLGVSVGGPLVSAGSLGAVVTDKQSGERMVLSNWHVFANSLNPPKGLSIWQPGRLDGGSQDDSFAELNRWLIGPYDAAVARLIGERPVKSETIEGRVFGGPRPPVLGMTVWKSSRTSGLTYGFIDGVQMQLNLDYPGVGPRHLQRVFRIIPRPGSGDAEVSAPGDSGAVWVEATNNQAVGLHFAGEMDDQPEFALAHDLIPVLQQLNVRLAGALPAPPEPKRAPIAPPAGNDHSFWAQLLALLKQILSG